MSITLVITLITVAVSVLCFSNRDMFFKLDLSAYSIHHRKEFHRFLTHAFLHADWGHLVINMFVFYQFGKLVEMYFQQLFGEKWILYYLMLYIGGVLFSALPGYARNKNNPAYHAVGASGAVSAIVFSFILMEPFAPLGIIFIPIRIPAILFGLLYLAAEIYLDKKSSSNIAHSAHYFGAIFGFFFTLILEPGLLLLIFEDWL